jgi:hypothetical protein
MDEACNALPMTPTTTPAHTREQAISFLVEEFLDALSIGPSAPLSTPASCRVEQAPLSIVVRMLMSSWMPGTWDEFIASFSDDDGSPSGFLAQAYARWVLDVYEAMGAF